MAMKHDGWDDISSYSKSVQCNCEIETFDRSIKEYINTFLLNNEKSFLHLKTSEWKPVGALVLQVLRQLRDTESLNSMFVEWQHLSEYITREKKIPTCVSLLICKVTEMKYFSEQEGVLKKLVELLLENGKRKVILIAPKSDCLYEYMQKVKIIDTLVVNELGETPIDRDNVMKHFSELMGRKFNQMENFTKKIIANKTTKKQSIHATVWNGNANIVLRFLQQGVNLRTRNRQKDTLLHVAARRGHEEIIKDLLFYGIIDVNDRGALRRTALHWAADKGNKSLISFLLLSGAQTLATDKWHDTPLHLAARNGHSEATETLLEEGHNGANIHSKSNNCKQTALHLAARNGHSKVVATLLKHKANINMKDSENNTALHYSASNGHNSIVKQLIEQGAAINIKNTKGNTAFHQAVSGDHIELALTILQTKRVDINDKGEQERSALHMTAEKGLQDLAEILLSNGADKNDTDKDKLTPLHLAIKNAHEQVSQILIDNGADVNITNLKKQTPIHMAAKVGSSVNLIELLLDHGANIESKDNASWTPLHFACYNGREDLVGTLIRRGADVNANADDDYTPLHWAAYEGHCNIVKLLVDHGAKVGERNKFLQTAMDLARSGRTENEEIVELLTARKYAGV